MEVQVEYDYSAEERDELTLKQGDIVTNVSQFEEGWYIGILNGKEGVFPDNFVRIIKADPAKVESAKPTEKTDLQFSHPQNGHAAPSTPTVKLTTEINEKAIDHPKVQAQPMSTSPPPNNKDAEYVKVVFQYTPEQSDELELVVNDFLQVLSRDLPEEGWWRGLNIRTNKTGVFPDNFVKMADSNDPDFKRALADFKAKTTGSPTRASSTSRQPLGTSPGSAASGGSKRIENPLNRTESRRREQDPADSSPGDRGRLTTASGRRIPGKSAPNPFATTNSRSNDKTPVKTDTARNSTARNETTAPKTSTAPLLLKNTTAKTECEQSANTTNKTGSNRSRGTSLTRLDNSRSGEGFTRNFGDLQQVVHEQQERLKAFNSQLENFNLIVGSLRREQREHADDVASQLRELSKQLTSVKSSQMTTQATVTTHQKLVTDRLQSLMLELDDVKKSRSEDMIELNRIKKIVFDLDSRALTSNLLTTGAGEDYHGRASDLAGINVNASTDPSVQPRTKLPPRGVSNALR